MIAGSQQHGGIDQNRVALNIKNLRALTIVAPVVFVLALELVSFFVLRPLFGGNSPTYVFLIFFIFIAGILPFSFWVFAVIERQQRDLAQSAALLSSVKDYAIFMLDPEGRVMTWSPGAERVKGYSAEEIIGKPLETFYSLDDVRQGMPANTLEQTARLGQYETEGWRVRKDGSRFWGNIVSTAVHDQNEKLLGFTHVARDITERKESEERIQVLKDRLLEETSTSRDRLQAWSEELEAKVSERTREIERYSRELTTRVLQAQEEERKRIARELHDDTAQSLSTLLINLDLVEPFVPPDSAPLRAGFDRIRTLTERTLDNIRALSHDLRPTILDDFGLIAALRWYADEYEVTSGVRVHLEIKAPPQPLTPDVELALFRIAQEALTNSRKHAEATEARLKLTFPQSYAVLLIEDNGKGFDTENLSGPTKHGGLGIYGMQERAGLLGATLELNTTPGKGTCVSLTVPLELGERSHAP